MGRTLYSKLCKYINALVILVTIILITLIVSGVTLLWVDGLSYVAYNPKYEASYNILEKSYILDINLNDLKSNHGKIIYSDGKNKIYINSIIPKDNGYIINFRSSGNYSVRGGTLVSAIEHKSLGNNLSTMIETANMVVEYNEIKIPTKLIGESGIHYKDGDEFSFFFKLSENSKNVTIKLSDLCKHTWIKK